MADTQKTQVELDYEKNTEAQQAVERALARPDEAIPRSRK